MTPSYDSGKIRILLTEGFSAEELHALAFDEPGFKPVFHQLASNSGKAEIISRLLEHAERTRQLEQLLELAKSSNPAQYARYEPYAYDHAAASSPYPGMHYFDVGDAGRFFGRELLTARLVGRLTPSPALPLLGGGSEGGSCFLAVVGASGSGKSSVVRAGLVPALLRGQPLADGSLPPEGSSQWPIHVITPTVHPLEALAASLTREAESVTATATLIDDMAKDPRSLHLYVRKLLAQGTTPPNPPLKGGGSNLLLVVDQFEELFTLCRDEAERRAFVDNLLAAVAPETDGPTLVVITLRADFYAHCAQYETLREALARRQEYIGPMSREELRRAIELPAQQAGCEFEPGLAELILRDVGDEPGALPLLSHALLETWRRRQGHLLTLAGYAESGGVRGAIAKTADSVFGRLASEQQAIARRIFLRLTELGEGAQDTRRRTALSELEALTTADQRVQSLPLGPPTAEAFTAQPPALRPKGVPNGSIVASVLQTLADARLVTTDKEAVEVAHEALIREWPTLRTWLNDNREGLRLHRHLSEAAQEWQRMDRDPGVLYRGAKLAQASEWAEQQPGELNALEQQFLTASKQAEENERLRELEQARALAEAERRRAEAEQQRAEEQKQAAARLRKRALIATAVGVIALIAAAAAGFFAWQANENAKLAATREAEARQQEAAAREQADRATAHRLAAEGRLLFEEKPLLGLRLALEGWALSSAYDQIDQFIREMMQQGRLLTLGQGDVEAIYTSDKNPSMFVLDRANAPGELRRTNNGRVIATLSSQVSYVTFSPDEAGTYFVVDYFGFATPSELRRSADGQVIATLAGPIQYVTFSSDEAGTYFVVDYFDVASASELRRSADGTIIATLSSPAIQYVTFSPDEAGTYFVVSYFDLRIPGELRRSADGGVVPLSGPISGVTFSPDEAGTYFVVDYVDYIDGTSGELRRSTDGQLIATLSGPVNYVTFSPDEDGTYLVVGYNDETPGELRRSADGEVIATLSGPVSPYFGVTFSPDEAGTYFFVRYLGGAPNELRRSADGKVVPLSGEVSDVTFSPDEGGTYFIVGYERGTPGELRRSADGKIITTLSGPVSNATFSPDEAGTYFVVGYNDETSGELRSTTDGQVIATLSGPVSDVTFSPDEVGIYFIVAYVNGQHELWQAQSEPNRLTELGLGLKNNFFFVASDRLITQYSDGRAYLQDLAWLRAMGGKVGEMPIQELVHIACAGPFASGLFDEAELKPYLAGREPQVCK
ncbi:MAG: hypothetical protein HS126_27420 [Anaerolineales bacterium]|nr:hypothetical protein [Anaerolineales bacterium]